MINIDFGSFNLVYNIWTVVRTPGSVILGIFDYYAEGKSDKITFTRVAGGRAKASRLLEWLFYVSRLGSWKIVLFTNTHCTSTIPGKVNRDL